jgi:hypothetical protein
VRLWHEMGHNYPVAADALNHPVAGDALPLNWTSAGCWRDAVVGSALSARATTRRFGRQSAVLQ